MLLEVVEDNRVFRANDLFIALSRSLFDFKLQKKNFSFFFFFQSKYKVGFYLEV